MDEKPLFTIARWSAAIVAAILATAVTASLLTPTFGRISERGNITKGISSCRQIITAMRLYAADHDGNYPTGKTANEAFRELLKAEILDSENVFGCPLSLSNPDYVIGSAPDFAEAVKPGENHWAMTKSLTDYANSSIPLVFENPVKAEWPPKWNATDAQDPKKAGESVKAVKGRSWKGGTIIIGLNDSSVSLQDLAAKSGTAAGLAPIKGEKLNLFEKAIDPVHFPKGEVLDVE